MKPSGIGGQAVMEGVMMKNKETYAVAVRKPNKEIVVDVQTYGDKSRFKALRKIPFVRGVFNFVDSLFLGTKVLTYSASFFEDEDVASEEAVADEIIDEAVNENVQEIRKETTPENISEELEQWLQEMKAPDEKTESGSAKVERKTSDENTKVSESKEKKTEESEKEGWFAKHKESIFMTLTVCFSLVMSIGIFFCVPFFITELFRNHITTEEWIVSIVEGILRITIFIVYVVLISFMEDIQRVFMYHGAEHKSINCIENGMELNVENVKKCSRLHKRCGTSFLLLVMMISIIFLFFVRAESRWVRLAIRLTLIPVIAGVSYEFIRLAGRSENRLVGLLSKPGMWLQKLTTREPDDDMIEVAIASVEAVFDWKAFLQDGELDAIEEKQQDHTVKEVSKEDLTDKMAENNITR